VSCSALHLDELVSCWCLILYVVAIAVSGVALLCTENERGRARGGGGSVWAAAARIARAGARARIQVCYNLFSYCQQLPNRTAVLSCRSPIQAVPFGNFDSENRERLLIAGYQKDGCQKFSWCGVCCMAPYGHPSPDVYASNQPGGGC
jgi:hypothetical protein